MENFYTDGGYLANTKTWHTEDSNWKAEQIVKIMANQRLTPQSVVDVGCGAGVLIHELSKREELRKVQFSGYDIAPPAIELAQKLKQDNVKFICEDLFAGQNNEYFDLLLAIDVFEHVPDYMGFLEKCRSKATYKIYHIPLDIHVSAVLRKVFTRTRKLVGHLHYFTAETALATLEDTGHQVMDYFYTSGALGLFRHHPKISTLVANGPRWMLSKLSVAWTARLLGGYSLLVLTK